MIQGQFKYILWPISWIRRGFLAPGQHIRDSVMRIFNPFIPIRARGQGISSHVNVQ
ncbi:hypothetical protein EMIT0111MI5_250010 [Burkholderia sp. IT-111MI5]